MTKIPIYKAEALDGLSDSIEQNNSIAYLTQLEPFQEEFRPQLIKSLASKHSDTIRGSTNDSDLYFTKSILVTTTWNKNDDVFSPIETWDARHTPTHKPSNVDHDEQQIVGHIVDCYPIDAEGKVIVDNCSSDELPDKFHLVVGAVIYKNWEGEDKLERTDTLINAIESGNKFVSMETLFTDFDYAIQTPDGKSHIKARTEETAWMTKHLRAHGGTGTYNDYKIGRLLKNMTFCGKGYVDKPANPESIIFSSSGHTFNFSTASKENFSLTEKSGVSIIRGDKTSSNVTKNGEISMSDSIYKDQADELKKSNADLESKLADMTDKLAKADVDKYTGQIDELKQFVDEQKTTIADLKKTTGELEAKVAETAKNLKAEQDAKAELETQLKEIKAAEAKANRISTLVDGGIDKESATKKAETFADLSNEQFTVIANELISAVKAQKSTKASDEKETETEEEADEEKDEAEADEKVLDNAEANDETDLNVDGKSTDNVDEMRKELRTSIATLLGHTLEESDSEEGDN